MPRFPLPARLCALALAAALIPAAALLPRPAPAAEPPHAAILMYHRFGEDRIPSTNIRLEQFDAQLAALKQAQIPVRPLPGIAAALKAGTPLPDRTVALTADDAYLSVLTEGWPRIRKAGYSLTLFVATGPVDQKLRGYLTWDQIRQLRDEGVTIGAHSNDHPSLPALTPDAMKADLDTSMRRFREELGEAPTLFAWPFGEWDAKSMAVLQGYGFEAAFGQHSGVAYAGHDMLWLPRFPMNEAFGSVERTLMAVNALPLPLSGIEPADVLIKLGQTTNPPVYRFTVGEGLERMKELLCYTGQGERIALKELGPRRYEAVPGKAFAPPRDRISCTLPTAQAGRFRWSGIQFTVQP
ncbi:polysaccharide deacetylase family protein [Ferrovibrio sp.]|uniref:polysaccharide deacetylase family protein n=1 Tax=Ferrovibrio sp. TaxID=1917215 RepID=UPI00311D5217